MDSIVCNKDKSVLYSTNDQQSNAVITLSTNTFNYWISSLLFCITFIGKEADRPLHYRRYQSLMTMGSNHGSVDQDLVTLWKTWSFLQISLKQSNTPPDHQVVSLVLWCSWEVYSPVIFKFLSPRWYNSEIKNTNNKNICQKLFSYHQASF